MFVCCACVVCDLLLVLIWVDACMCAVVACVCCMCCFFLRRVICVHAVFVIRALEYCLGCCVCVLRFFVLLFCLRLVFVCVLCLCCL